MVRFGRFEFDPATRRLRRDGADIHLTPKSFELLAALLETAPRVVSKRALHARLWPGGAVADATLVALIKHLRAAMQDRDPGARLIRTVHRVGYALEATVMRVESARAALADCWLLLGGRRMPLVTGENIVGRDAAAEVRLDHPAVSRRHARLLVTAGGALVEDLRSKNGTSIDRQPLVNGPLPLRDGMEIAFGTVVVTYRESRGGTPTLTHIGPAGP